MKHRTRGTKGAGIAKAAVTMAFKLLVDCEKRWHRLRGHRQIKKLCEGVAFVNGIELLTIVKNKAPWCSSTTFSNISTAPDISLKKNPVSRTTHPLKREKKKHEMKNSNIVQIITAVLMISSVPTFARARSGTTRIRATVDIAYNTINVKAPDIVTTMLCSKQVDLVEKDNKLNAEVNCEGLFKGQKRNVSVTLSSDLNERQFNGIKIPVRQFDSILSVRTFAGSNPQYSKHTVQNTDLDNASFVADLNPAYSFDQNICFNRNIEDAAKLQECADTYGEAFRASVLVEQN